MKTTIESVERTLMGAIFDDPETRIPDAMATGLTSAHFSDPPSRLCWKALENLMVGREPSTVDFITILNEADRIAEADSTLDGIPSDYFDTCTHYLQGCKAEERNLVRQYAEILIEHKAKSDIKAALERAAKALDHGGKVADVAELVSAKSNQFLLERRQKTKESLADKIRKIQSKTVHAHDSGAAGDPNYVPGLGMPWPMVNYFTKGLKPGLHIIAGRPSEGKTSYAIECMLYWLDRGYKVAFDCLDMPAEEFLKRLVCNRAKVLDDATSCGRYSEVDKSRMDSAFSELIKWAEGGSLMVEGEPSAERFAAWCRAMHSQKKLDVVVVDYVQLMTAAGKDGNENDKITKVLAALKSFAVSAEVPVVIISQMTRSKDKGDPGIPTLDELRGSGSLEQDAMTVVFVYRDRKATLGEHLPDCMFRKAKSGSVWDEPTACEGEIRNMITPIRWRLAKNQNGLRDVELPMLVYMGYYKWFVADYKTFYEQNGTGDQWQAYTRANVDLRQFDWPLTALDRGGNLIASQAWREQERRRGELALGAVCDKVPSSAGAGGKTSVAVGTDTAVPVEDQCFESVDDLVAAQNCAGF